MSLLGSILLDQAVPAGLGCFPLSQPCQAAGREPAVGCTSSKPGARAPQPRWPSCCGHGDDPCCSQCPWEHFQPQESQRDRGQESPGAHPAPPASSPNSLQEPPCLVCLSAAWPFLCHTSNVVLSRNLSLLTCLLNLQLLSVVLCQHKIIRNTGGSPRTAKAASEMLWEAFAGSSER